jgi:hypothetical protein
MANQLECLPHPWNNETITVIWTILIMWAHFFEPITEHKLFALTYLKMYMKCSYHVEALYNKENHVSWQDRIHVYEPPNKYVLYASKILLCVSFITETESTWHLNSEGCLHASITASANSVAPAPPSAQCLQITARKAPLSKLARFNNSHSATVSVLKHISQHFWMKFIKHARW